MSATATVRPLRRRPIAIGLAAAFVVVLLALYIGSSLQAAYIAWRFTRGLAIADCTDVWVHTTMPRPPAGCPPEAYGLPSDLHGHRLHWDLLPLRPGRQTAIAATVPGDLTAYSLHLVRSGISWRIDEVDVSA